MRLRMGIAALLLVASGCTGGQDEPPITGGPIEPTASASSEPPPSSPEPSPSPSSDYAMVDMSQPGEPAARGTAYEFGQVAWVKPTVEEDASPAPEGVTGVTVLDVVAGEAEFWTQFENSADFEGQLPYFVVYQYKPAEASDPAPTIWPQYADRGDAEYLSAEDGRPLPDLCPMLLPESDDGVEFDCLVASGTQDKPVARVIYNGLTPDSLIYGEEDIYAEAPLVWTAGA